MADNYRERNGYQIELRAREQGTDLLINGAPVDYDQLADGTYFLYKYAYDWTDSLMDLAEKYVDHQERVNEVRVKSKQADGEDE